ncbi:MAG: HEPN domain-containing protein [Candidatus Lokiarchaeota archaeon]
MGNLEEASRWVKQAEIDYQTAFNNLELESYEFVCFLSHQVAEKALKALLYYIGLRPFGHSLKDLVDDINENKNQLELEIAINCAIELDKHYIPTRYPDAFVSGIPHEYYTKKNAQDCLKWSKKILDSVGKYLKNIEKK